jgi:Pyridoxamine 5'-phosphate oxidase
MGKVYEQLDEALVGFIGRQHVFFVGTAPDSPDGHLNVSPKGLDCFRILGPKSVAYLDLTGSGIETVAHLRQNGRITILFCAFEGRPLILRLYGRGRVVEPGDPEWDGLIVRFPEYPGVRSVVVVDLERVADSCGFAVPLYEYRGERSQLIDYARKKGPEEMERYKAQKNRASIDGVAGLRSAGGEGS